MSKSEQISHMTDVMAKFVGYTGKVLPDDVTAKLEALLQIVGGDKLIIPFC